MAILTVLAVVAGMLVPAYGAEACKLPAMSILSRPDSPQYARPMFSSLGGPAFTTNLAAGLVQFSDTSYTVSEDGASVTILVRRFGDLSGQVTVDYAASDGTAQAGADYAVTFGTLTWEDGDGADKSFEVPIIDDAIYEGNETVNLSLSNPTGDIAIGQLGAAVLNIVDNEQAFGISVNDVTQAEGNSSNVLTFSVTLSGAATQPVTVNYGTVDGSATSASDYAASSGQLTFSPGVTSQSVSITINGDTAVELDESFFLLLSNPSNAAIADGTGVATLSNDDAAGTPTPTPTPGPTPTPTATPVGGNSVQFSSTSYSVNENVVSATITVTRTGTGNGAVSVNYATSNGSATAGQDYTGVSGTLAWPDGDTAAKTFSIPISDDTILEPGETVNIALSNPVNTAIGAPGTAVMTIIDNDATPQVSVSDVVQAEGNELNSMVFTVSLSAPSQQTVSLMYSTENGTATGGSDYVSVANSPLTFNPGEVTKQVSVNILGDFVVEPDENFLFNINSAVNAEILDSQGIGTLINDDSPGTIQFQSTEFTVNEGDGTAAITITRTGGGLSQGVTVRFVTVDGTALAGEDYTSLRTTVIFEPGQAAKTIFLPITNDGVDEPNETVNLALEAPTGGAVLGSPINSILTIIDNDSPPVLSVNDVTLNEGNTGTTAFTFTVSLAGTSSQPVNVSYATADGTASAPGDYAAILQGGLTFEPGQATKQVTVFVSGDFDNEPSETFLLNLSGAVGAAISDGQGLGTILNDDAGGAFRLTSSEYSVSESGAFITITVQRSGGLSNGASVDYSTANGSALAGQDYTAVSGTLVFSGGQTAQSFTIPINNDGLVEPTEHFSVILSNAAGGGSTLGVPNTALVFISDAGPASSVAFDYDGDGRADPSVYRPADNFWYLQRSTAGFTGFQWGIAGDRPAPADFDGDGRTDIAVFRPAEGAWYIVLSQSQTFQAFSWGANGDLPVPADHNGDGRADLVVYRNSDNTFYKTSTTGSFFQGVPFGIAGDKPQIGDFDADGRADVAVYRPSDNNWYVLRSSGGFTAQRFGEAGDIPTPADYDGDGRTDPAVFRPSTGIWHRTRSQAGGYDSVSWGQNGDVPVAADYDGDGKADSAVFRPAEGVWYLNRTTAGLTGVPFGQSGDIPTPSAFIY